MESSARLLEQIKNSKSTEHLQTSLSEDVLSESKSTDDEDKDKD